MQYIKVIGGPHDGSTVCSNINITNLFLSKEIPIGGCSRYQLNYSEKFPTEYEYSQKYNAYMFLGFNK